MAPATTYAEEDEEDESIRGYIPKDNSNQQENIGGITARDPDSGEPLLCQNTLQHDNYSHYELIQLNNDSSHNECVTDKGKEQSDGERNSRPKDGNGQTKSSKEASPPNKVPATILSHQRNSNCGYLAKKFMKNKILPCHGMRRIWGITAFYVFLILIFLGKQISMIGKNEQKLLKYEQVTDLTKSAYPTVTFCNQSPFDGEKLEEYYLNQITDMNQEVDPQLEFLMALRLLNTMLQLASQNSSTCESFENIEKYFWGDLRYTPDSKKAVKNSNQVLSSKRNNIHIIEEVSKWIRDNYENTNKTVKYRKKASEKENTEASGNEKTHKKMSKSKTLNKATGNEKNIRKYESADLEDRELSHHSRKAQKMIRDLNDTLEGVKDIDDSIASGYGTRSFLDDAISPDQRKKRDAKQSYEYHFLPELFYENMLKRWTWPTDFMHVQNDEDILLLYNSLSDFSIFSLELTPQDLNGSLSQNNQSLVTLQADPRPSADAIMPVTLQIISILESNWITYMENLPSANYEALEWLKILNEFPYLNFQASLLEELDNLPLFDYHKETDYVWMKNAKGLTYIDLDYQVIIDAFPFLSWYYSYTYASTLDTWNFFLEQEYPDNATIGVIELFTKYFIPPNSYSNWKWEKSNQHGDNPTLATLHGNGMVKEKQKGQSIFAGAGGLSHVDSLEPRSRSKRSQSALDIDDIEGLLLELIESRGISASQLLNVLDLSISHNRRLLINDKQLSHYEFTLQDMLLECRQQAIPCTENDFESWSHPHFGTCFTLNSSRVEQLDDKQSPLGAVQSGISLILGSEASSSFGYIVSVHHPDVKPDMWMDGVVVRPSQNVRLMLKEKRYERSDDDKRDYTGPITHSCHDICYNEIVKERCSCTQLHELNREEVQSTRCNSTHWNCLLKLMTLNTNASCSACKPKYRDSIYEVELSTVNNQPGSDYVYRSCRSDDNITYIRNHGIETRIYINLKTNYAETYTAISARSMLASISDVAVMLYLFTGASILTIIQSIEFIIQLLLGAEKEAVYKSTAKNVIIADMRKIEKRNEGAMRSGMLSSTSV